MAKRPKSAKPGVQSQKRKRIKGQAGSRRAKARRRANGGDDIQWLDPVGGATISEEQRTNVTVLVLVGTKMYQASTPLVDSLIRDVRRVLLQKCSGPRAT